MKIRLSNKDIVIIVKV